MIKKKVLALALCVSCIGGISAAIYNYEAKADEIKLLDYRAPEEVSEKGYQIDKYENVNAVAWLNENEVLTATRKSPLQGSKSYISIYNVNTKESRDFTEVNMNEFFGISKSGKFALYCEYRSINLNDESEESTAYHAGTIQRVPMKILNLETGEITNLKTQNINGDADYSWISDDKILVIYNNNSNMWQIINKNGDVCSEGKFEFDNPEDTGVFLAGTEELEDLGDTVEGNFYYTKWFRRADNSIYSKVFSMDVNTKKEEPIEGTDGDDAQKRGNSILMGHYNNNGEALNGVYVNRTFGFRVFDKKGSIIQTQESPLGLYCENYKLSNDGGKVCYLESNHDISKYNKEILDSTVLKVMDVESGNIKEISNVMELIEVNLGENQWAIISNLEWDESDTSLIFTIEYCERKMFTLTLDEEGKKAHQTEDDTIEFPTIQKVKSDTYVITFDK